MSIEITFDQAKELIDRAIEEKGADYVYGRSLYGCVYFEPEGKPSCIVGHVLSYVGLTAKQAEAEGWNTGVARDVLTDPDIKILSLDRRASEFLDKIQELQDTQWEWGAARDMALAHIARLFDKANLA